MRQKVLALIVCFSLMTSLTSFSDSGRGGLMGFISGCCFGVRTAGEYNDGKEIHWREWGRIVPFVGFIFGIWDGIEGSEGITNQELVERYGSTFY